MDKLERLQVLITVADDVLARQEHGEQVDNQAIIVAMLIEREIHPKEESSKKH